MAAPAGDAQDREGRQALLRAVLLGVARARDARHASARCSRCAPAATRCSATARGPASSTRSSAASARAACRSIATEYEEHLAPGDRCCSRARTSRSFVTLRRAHAGGRRGPALRGGGAAARSARAPSRRRRSASRRSRTGAAIRTSSASIARAASSRCRCCSCAAASSPATSAYSFEDLEFPDEEILGVRADAVLPGRTSDARRDPGAASSSRTRTCAPSI